MQQSPVSRMFATMPHSRILCLYLACDFKNFSTLKYGAHSVYTVHNALIFYLKFFDSAEFYTDFIQIRFCIYLAGCTFYRGSLNFAILSRVSDNL